MGDDVNEYVELHNVRGLFEVWRLLSGCVCHLTLLSQDMMTSLLQAKPRIPEEFLLDLLTSRLRSKPNKLSLASLQSSIPVRATFGCAWP